MVAVAMDGQGWTRARPFVEKAGLTFPTAVDREGKLWEQYDFDVVPVQLYFDESGALVYRSSGGPKGDVLERLDVALAAPRRAPAVGAATQPSGAVAPTAETAEAQELFARGVAALDAGRSDEAAALWRRALALDPQNWLIRKQVWALENPDRFYDGPIDAAWQKRELELEPPPPRR